jgi:conserved oligomeric Golgi complex subunit 3
MHLLYTRFTTVAGQLAPLLGEFERRARAHPEELGALLSECHAAYFSARKNLLISRLTEQIRGLDPTRTELVELVRLFVPYPSKSYIYTTWTPCRHARGAAT